jgi:rubrerythrin
MKIEEKDGKLIITDFDEVETYMVACKIEQDGIDFYRKFSNEAKNEVKKTLDFLIDEEQKHLRFFNGRLYDLRGKANDSYDENDLLTSINYKIFWPYQDMPEIKNIIATETKALNLAVAIEDKSIQYYTSLGEKVLNESAQREIVTIIEEEKKHKALFEKLLENKRPN